MLRKIYEDTNLSQTLAQIKETVQFDSISIHIAGTNDTAQTLTLANVGRVIYEKNNRTVVDADFEYLFILNSILNGNPKNASATAGVVNFFVQIPRRLNDDNIETVVPSDNAQIKISHPSAFGTALASATIAVYLNIESGRQIYDLKINQLTKAITGASSTPMDVEHENVLMTLNTAKVSNVLTTTGSNITRIRTEVENLVGDGSIQALIDDTNMRQQLESDFILAVVTYLAEGDITGRLADNMKFSFDTSGASQVETLVLGASFNLERLHKTTQAQQARLTLLSRRKLSLGKNETVEVINKVRA